jgi:hypothetical protein
MRRSIAILSLLLLASCDRTHDAPGLAPAAPDALGAVVADAARVRAEPLSEAEADVVADSMVYLAVHEGAQSVMLLERDLEASTSCSVGRTAFQLVHPRDDAHEARRARRAFANELHGESLIVGSGSEPMGGAMLHLVIGVRCVTTPFVP